MKYIHGLTLSALLIFLLGVWQTVLADPPLPTPVGRVIWVKGELKATMPNNEQRLLQKMSVIYLSDVLSTDDKSQAQITFTDGSSISFYPNTKFQIAKYAYAADKKKGSVGSYVMDLIQGGFRTITGLIAKGNPSDYQVNTPVATIGVRGTDYVAYIKDKKLYVGYYQGTPCVSNKLNKELCLSAKTRYAMVAADNVAPVPLAQQPDFFKEKLVILPTSISPFSTGGTVSRPTRTANGVINSFCISQ